MSDRNFKAFRSDAHSSLHDVMVCLSGGSWSERSKGRAGTFMTLRVSTGAEDSDLIQKPKLSFSKGPPGAEGTPGDRGDVVSDLQRSAGMRG